jgi:hypothetical protein
MFDGSRIDVHADDGARRSGHQSRAIALPAGDVQHLFAPYEFLRKRIPVQVFIFDFAR